MEWNSTMTYNLVISVIGIIIGLAIYFNAKNEPLNEWWKLKFDSFEGENSRPKMSWNWAAFLFGGFWLLSKGMWAYAAIIAVLTQFLLLFIIKIQILSLILLIGFSVFIGLYGNYMNFKFKKSKLQINPNIIAKLFSIYFLIRSVRYFLSYNALSDWRFKTWSGELNPLSGLVDIEISLKIFIHIFYLFASMIGLILSNIKYKTWEKIDS